MIVTKCAKPLLLIIDMADSFVSRCRDFHSPIKVQHSTKLIRNAFAHALTESPTPLCFIDKFTEVYGSHYTEKVEAFVL